jgi:hypothetical protein
MLEHERFSFGDAVGVGNMRPTLDDTPASGSALLALLPVPLLT